MAGPFLRYGFTKDEQEALAEEFCLSPLQDIECVQLLDNSSLVLFKDSTGVKLVKKYRVLDAKRVSKLDEILGLFVGEKILPEFFVTRTGRFVLEVNQNYFSVMRFVPTIPLPFPAQSSCLIKVLARMHLLLATVKHENLSAPLALPYDRLESLLVKNGCRDLLSYLSREAAVKGEVRRQLVHNDLHKGNFICSVKSEIFIVDLESFSANSLIGDVMFAAFRLCSGNKRQIDEFVAAYDKVNPLSSGEKFFSYLFLLVDFIKKLGFILDQKERGNCFYMKDFKKYNEFIACARDFV